jgi:hypothetical protein
MLLQVKLAISHALAQSTLLGCYEERLQVRWWCGVVWVGRMWTNLWLSLLAFWFELAHAVDGCCYEERLQVRGVAKLWAKA